SRAFPELASAVRAVIGSATAAWERAVRDALPAADRLTMDQLRDDMPISLAHVADALESTRRYETNVLVDAAPKHGSVRYDQGFKLNEVLIEYSILRETVVVEVAAHLRRNLEATEILALGAALDVTVRRAVVRFVEHLTGQLQAATEAQSKYLSFLSHDLRGGLNGVFLMIEVLKRELAGETRLAETIDDLDVMRRSLLETVATMDRFLHAERFRKGKIQVRPARVNLRSLMQEIAAHFTYQARDKKLKLVVDVPQDLSIISDKELLTLVFQNLLSNALKYSGTGTTVSVSALCASDACKVSVTDQGPGIATDKLGELFTPYSRGETYGQPGVGLGLTIARQAAGYLHAKLWAESELGKGSTFIVELPHELQKQEAEISKPPTDGSSQRIAE
ncbi:MAG TPA: HAMP domain-containing sensor histidine kinase, partial [Tepidisphaeraceae bacterium]|nr:HAMP domain-containing sensor histidine kinase [Tepidisphaeraceae bacterium]